MPPPETTGGGIVWFGAPLIGLFLPALVGWREVNAVAEMIRQPAAAWVVLSARLIRQLGAPSSTLRAFVERDENAVIVRTGGEVDAGNESTWRDLLAEASAAADGSLIVDLTGLTFIGCGALEALLQQFRWCRRRGLTMKVATEQTVIRHVFEACPDGDSLPMFLSVDAALGREPQSRNDLTDPNYQLAHEDLVIQPSIGPLVAEWAAPVLQRPRLSAMRRLSALGGLLARRRRNLPHVGFTTDLRSHVGQTAQKPSSGSDGSAPIAV